jgi:AraC-like DNA-binding protein
MVRFSELRGRLEPYRGEPGPARTSVVLSNISHGDGAAPPMPGLSVCWVGRGVEHYRVGGRGLTVRAGEMLVMPQALGGEVNVHGGTAGGTLGVCVFLPGDEPLGESSPLPQAPFVVAPDGALGRVFARQALDFDQRVVANGDATGFLARTRPHVQRLLQQLAAQVDAVGGRRRTTRQEAVRRAHRARSLLHEDTGRAVPLAELARHAAMSPFQLLRTFRDCFGEPPALYHRKLRLHLADAAVAEDGLTREQAALRFGFAGAASLAHARRRTFG